MTNFGFLNVNKPAGVTSRWVVDRVQKLVRPDKAGHAGTLDPLATGVLVVALGQATRLIEYVQRMKKHYRGTFLLGRSSDTEDVEGKVTELANPPMPRVENIKAAAMSMIGEIMQRPPSYSAVKIAGRRAYDLARAGNRVELATRPVQVYRLEIVEYDYPQLTLNIECGGGTYVRTLGRELAERCGTCAVMSELARTAVGEFRLEQAIDVASLLESIPAQALVSPLVAVAGMSRLEVESHDAKRLLQGLSFTNRTCLPSGEAAAIDCDGQLSAIVSVDGEFVRPLRYFPRSVDA